MNIHEAMKKIADDTGMTFAALSRAMGRHYTYISSNLGRGRCPLFDNVIEMVRTAGYSICIVRQGDEPEGSIVVDTSLDAKKQTARQRDAQLRKERERRKKALLAELERLDSE